MSQPFFLENPADVQTHFDSMPDHILTINVAGRRITALPDLTRFTRLTILNCEQNRLTELPKLPDSLTTLYCSHNALEKLPDVLPSQLKVLDMLRNRLTKIPALPQNMINIDLSYNQIQSVPRLPNSLLVFACIQNNISVLPALPEQIHTVVCSKNQLTSLPQLDNIHHLTRFIFYDNPIYQIIQSTKGTVSLAHILRVIGKVKHTFYKLKCRNKLRAFLYKRILEPKIRAKYHPSKLNELLNEIDTDDEDAFHDALSNW